MLATSSDNDVKQVVDVGSKLSDDDLKKTIKQLIEVYKNRETRTVEVLYSSDYGGICFSEEFMTLLRLKSQELADEIEESLDYISVNTRTDPIVIELVKELKSKAVGHYANLDIQTITLKKGEYVYISEYDGKEDVHVRSGFGM